MNTELDSLEVRVQDNAASAASGLNKLVGSLNQLKGATKDVTGLSLIASGLEGLNKALSELQVNKKGLGILRTELNGLSNVKTHLTATANQINKINAAMKGLEVDDTKLQKLVTSLNSLGQVQKAAGLTSVISALKQIPAITKSLSSQELQKFGLQIRLVTKYLAPLAAEMEKVSRGFSAFPARIQRIIQSNAGLAASNQKVAKSYKLLENPLTFIAAKFAAYQYVISRVVNFLADSVMSINEYVENVNLFQVSMGEFYDEAAAYAQLVSDKLGVDPSRWMRTQGVFMSIASGFGVSREQAYALSEGLTELSYDLSSLYNEDVTSSAQRLQSALAGEIEPIRRLGISITEATLKEFALSKGIDESVESMTEQEKALLRTLKLMEGSATIGAIGDFARTLESPANALRVLKQQLTQLSRALGSVLIPILVQVLPYIQAFVELLTEAISALARLLNLEMPEWDTGSWGSEITTGADEAADAVGSATDAVKELKNATLGIDELNILAPTGGGAGGGAAGGGGGSDWADSIEIPNIWDQEAIAQISTKADEIKEKLRPILELALAIGAAFLAWKIATGVFGALAGLKTGLDGIKTAVGVLMGGSALGGLNSLLSKIAGAIAAIVIQFNAAGGGARGVLAVVKLLGSALATPLTIIILMVAQFVNLWNNSEKFRTGIQRLGEIIQGVFKAAGDILDGILTVFKDIGLAILDLLPDPVKNAIISALETIKDWASKLDIGFGDLGVTLAGIGLLFVPGGQVLGVVLLAFEAITVAIRALGGLSDETWESIKHAASEAWNGAKESALEAWESIKHSASEAWESIKRSTTEAWAAVKESASEAWSGVKEGTKSLWESIKATFNNIGDAIKEGIKNGLNGAISTLNRFIQWVNSKLRITVPEISVFGQEITSGFTTQLFTIPLIPTFSTGGYPDQGQLFLANEAGPELVGQMGRRTAVANSDQIVEGIAYGVSTANEPLITAVYAAAQQIIRAVEAGGDVYMDGYKVGQRTTASQNRQNRVYGKTLQNV